MKNQVEQYKLTTRKMVEAAIKEHPDSKIFVDSILEQQEAANKCFDNLLNPNSDLSEPAKKKKKSLR